MDKYMYENWRKSVGELNQNASKIDSDRKEMYEWMANEIKAILNECDMVAKNVNFTTDGSVIQVRLEDVADSIRFPLEFIDSISMPFSVKRILNSECNYELFIELYPLEGS